MPTSAHSRHRAVVASSTASLAAITKSAQSAARSPARTSPTKSAYPGVSTKLILVSRWTTGAMAREMERSWARSDSSKSQTVEPSWIVPARGMAPAEASSVSTKVVLPEPPGPTSTTLRIRSGLLAPRSCPAVLRPPALSAMRVPPGAKGGPGSDRRLETLVPNQLHLGQMFKGRRVPDECVDPAIYADDLSSSFRPGVASDTRSRNGASPSQHGVSEGLTYRLGASPQADVQSVSDLRRSREDFRQTSRK